MINFYFSIGYSPMIVNKKYLSNGYQLPYSFKSYFLISHAHPIPLKSYFLIGHWRSDSSKTKFHADRILDMCSEV